jgi:hypothetical protein
MKQGASLFGRHVVGVVDILLFGIWDYQKKENTIKIDWTNRVVSVLRKGLLTLTPQLLISQDEQTPILVNSGTFRSGRLQRDT